MISKAWALGLVLAPWLLPAQPPWEKPLEVGRYLFLENCTVCHEIHKPKSAKLGPSLLRFKKLPPERVKPFRGYIITKIKTGGPVMPALGGVAMPSFGATLTEEQIRKIAAFLLPQP